MQRTKTNPYADCSLREIWEACQRRAGELQERGIARTPGQREQLAESTAFLLLAAARVVAPAEYDGTTPERELRHGRASVADAFADGATKEIRDVRFRMLVRAADHVHGAGGWHWMRNTQIDGREVCAVAVESDDGLRRVLQLLAGG